jgi:endonuclease YncB( thermonuclease family)
VRRRITRGDVIPFKRDGARPSQNISHKARFRGDRSTRRIELQTLLLACVLFFGVFGAGLLYTQPVWLNSGASEARAFRAAFQCRVAHVTDGDTFRCADGTRVRLSGIAARESDGSCRPGHPCPVASAEAATAALYNFASGHVLMCRPVGETYGRVAAFCRREDGLDLSCAMMQSGTVEKWWRFWGLHSC